MKLRLPEGYRADVVDGTRLWAREDVAEFVSDAVKSAGSLFAFAATHPDREGLGSGRGPIYALPTPYGHWVVRRCRRGGWVRWLDDRFLAIGRPRVFRELRVSLDVRARGVPTPEVLAAALYPAGLFHRADLVTVRIPEGVDLATLLFGPRPLEEDDRILAWAAAGRLLRWLHTLGVMHPDLSLGNILLECCTHPMRPYLLDLDRCRMVRRVSGRQRRRMLRRFRRSAQKWSRMVGRLVTFEEWGAFRSAYRTIRV